MRSRLLATVVVTFLSFIAFNRAVRHQARNSVPRQLLTSIDSTTNATVIAVGNSLMAAGFDGAEFTMAVSSASGRAQALNLGLGSSSPVEHLLLTRQSLARDPHVKLLVYGFSDEQMRSRPERAWWHLIGNFALSFYVEPTVAGHYYATSGYVESLAFRVVAELPVFVERGAIWGRVERIRRTLGGLGLPPVAETRFGRVSDFEDFQLGAIPVSPLRASEADDAELFSEPMRDLIATAQAHGVHVVLVSMPRQATHRDHISATPGWRAYRDRLSEWAQKHDVRIIDAADWVQDEFFEDRLHLGPGGARVFSHRLGQELATQLR
jgi:hypothetical protein